VAKAGRLVAITDQGLRYLKESDASISLETTIILHALEHSSVYFSTLGSALHSSLHSGISFSLYLSNSVSTKLCMHVDKWDNIVVQISGSKTFLVEGRVETLSAGDLLQIPQDVAHDVATPNESIHLSVALLRPYWL
jgi:mannose-6-phosphate isomerase-like protein (cupin superfamily)